MELNIESQKQEFLTICRVSIQREGIEDLLEWQQRKRELEAGEISPDEYMNWKLNWPQTSDQAGRHSQKKAWRNAPEDEA